MGRTKKNTAAFFIITAIATLFATVWMLGARTVQTSAEDTLSERTRYYESYEVDHNDSLWKIAGRFGSEYGIATKDYLQSIRDLNQLTGDRIVPGETILVIRYE